MNSTMAKIQRSKEYKVDSYLSIHGGINGMTHDAMDHHTKRDLCKNIVNYDRDPSLFFPCVSLPSVLCGTHSPRKALYEIFEAIINAGLYHPDDAKWRFNLTADYSADLEQLIPAFFNSVISVGYSKVAPTTPGTTWYQHSETLLESIRKPDVILVPSSAKAPYKFRDIYSYCELKRSFNKPNATDALLQLSEIASYATAVQVNRRFYVASSLCGRQLTLAFFVRGATVISMPLDIDKNPLQFLTILISLSSADATWNGFDPNMVPYGANNFRVYNFSPAPTLRVTGLLLFASKAMHGRGTKVPLCLLEADPSQEPRSVILKMSWLSQGSVTDIEISELMKTRSPRQLQGREAELFGEQDVYDIFRDSIKPLTTEAQWDYERNLPGIPIVLACQRPQADNPQPDDKLRADGYYPEIREPRMCPDTTKNILARFDVPVRDVHGGKIRVKVRQNTYKEIPLFQEPRESIWILYDTPGTSFVWFSCRRELLYGFMGAIAAHFNALRMDILHCDVSDANTMYRVESAAVHHVVPDWPKETMGFPKRAGMLGDWGYAADLRSPEVRTERVTGTFPFMACELLSEAGHTGKVSQEVRHDLESFFWVFWIFCVNMNGPFYQRRIWKDKEDVTKVVFSSPHESGTAVSRSATVLATLATPDAQLPLPQTRGAALDSGSGSTSSSVDSDLASSTLVDVQQELTRLPLDDRSPVPVWATPGVHHTGTPSVHIAKQNLSQTSFIDSLSPYFYESGEGFLEGLKELHGYFVVGHERVDKPITHRIFVEILKKMSDSIDPQKDRTSEEAIEQGRVRYGALLAQGGTQGIAISALDGPKYRGPASRNIYVSAGRLSLKRPGEAGWSETSKRSKL